MAAKRQIDSIAERAVRAPRPVAPSDSRAAGASSRRAADPSGSARAGKPAGAAKRPDRAGAKSDRLRTDRVQRVANRSALRGSGSAVSDTTANPQKKQSPAGRQPARQPAPKTEQASDRYIWPSLMLLFLAGYLAVSAISYLIYWDVDQNIATWGHLFANPKQDAMNWGGRIGAILADSIVGRWFGIFGELFALLVFFFSIKLMRLRSMRLRRAIRSTLLLMIIGSIAAGHFWGADPQVFGSGWGGAHGVFVAQWLEAMIGYEGTSLLVIVLSVGTLYYANGWLIRQWAAQWKAYSRRKREERRVRSEMARIAAQERMLRMRAAMERQREAMAAFQSAQPIPQPPAATPPDTPEPPEAKPQAAEPPIPPQSQPAAHPVPEPYVPAPAERNRLVANYDGSWGYLVGYDSWGQPVVYSFDRETYYYNLYYPSGYDSAGYPTAPEEQPEAAPSVNEEEVRFTVASRPPAEPEEPARPTPRPLQPDEDPGFIVEQPEEEQVDDEVINSSDLYDPTLELSHYRKPPVELLDDHTKRVTVTDAELVENKNRIVTTLENFGIRIDTIEATIGPTVTLYEIVPAPGVRISKIKNLEDDIALSLAALGIRIIAPIPGKGTVGIEVPNKDKEVVSMYSVIKSPRFHDSRADLPVALGKTIQNETFVFDLAKMPHLLVAGATGQGKSVGLNAIITSLLYKKHPAELKFILVDPKKVELTLYAKLEKHFLAKMPAEEEAIITDTQKVIYTLNSICIEMDARYDLLKAAKVRNIKEYNEKFINRRLNPEKGHRYLPYFVVIVDEFADLIMTAGREIETPIARIAQLARAVGIHLIIATQRPTTNIITGVIKANFPARIAFRVTSMIDSRTILDQPGANQLVGRGDMLISTGSEMTRVQCAFIDTPEVERITDHIERQQGYPSAYELPEYTPEGEESGAVSGSDLLAKRDSLFEEVARYVVANQQGSASTIQRKFSIGFNRAGRLIDQLEAAGIVGHSEGGGKPRQVLVNDPMSLETILDNL